MFECFESLNACVSCKCLMLIVHFSSKLFFLGSVCFASDKSCTEALLPLVEHDWLQWSHDDTQRDKGLGLTLQLTQRRQEAANSFVSTETMTTLIHLTEPLQMSRSTKQIMRSELVMSPL